MIGKVVRGTDVAGLLRYLYGLGKANEHLDPHLVAGFGDPADLEPGHYPDGRLDFRRLTGLFLQPLAALYGPGYDKPVWHCSARAAPGDRILFDGEWADVAQEIMHRTGLAPRDGEAGVRWVAVRHADDHVHIVATLARENGTRPKIWNDFYRVREACRAMEKRLGLHATAPADRTAAKRPTRAEAEQAARRGWSEPARVTLRRHVCAAAAGASTEREFFDRLADAGVLVRRRCSTINPGEVTGYAVGLAQHTSRDGGVVWYGGGKLAADLTLPKLRARWHGAGADRGIGPGLSAPAARAVLRNAVTSAAAQARSEPDFFARLREAGITVRLRFSEVVPGQVTGYSVTLPGHIGQQGSHLWYGGGRLSAELTLPRLRRWWRAGHGAGAERSGAYGAAAGTAGFTAPERDAIYEDAARQAAAAAEHIRCSAERDPAGSADAAWATANTLHAAAWATGNRALRRAADAYDRCARVPYGRIPRRTADGEALRTAARVIALVGRVGDDVPVATAALLGSLLALVAAVAELRQAQQHATQAGAARAAAQHLHAAFASARTGAPDPLRTRRAEHARRRTAAGLAALDVPVSQSTLGHPPPTSTADSSARPGPRTHTYKRSGPSP